MSRKFNNSQNSAQSPKNTLFNYFSKSPANFEKKKLHKLENPAKPPKDSEENGHSEVNKEEILHKPQLKDDSEDEEIKFSQKGRKRRRLLLQCSDEEDKSPPRSKAKKDCDYEPCKEEMTTSSDDDESKEIESDSDSSPVVKTKKEKGSDEAVSGARSFMEKLQQIQSCSQKTTRKQENNYEEYQCSTSNLDEPLVWPHQKLEFLQPDKIKDKEGRRPQHPDYDPTTLFVPQKFLDSLSPGVRQWWVLKSNNYDCVLFFKVGKFYELYHMDADVGVNELGFTYMRGEFAHSGFPEVSFDKMSAILIDRGYKVARVEQTETPDMMAERCKLIRPTKFDKVVRREICQIVSRGTQVYSSHCQITANHQPNYMLAIVELQLMEQGGLSCYGICFLDTSIGDCHLGEFDDDKNCSRLHTLLSHYMPALVLYEKGNFSARTQEIMRTVLSGVQKELMPATGNMRCSAEKTLKILAEEYYSGSSAENGSWPLVLRTMQAECDHLGLTPHPNAVLALKALGLCIQYMKKCQIAEKVLPMTRYHLYEPPELLAVEKCKSAPRRAHMVLDATTLMNLRITGEEHSLQSTLDQCCTKFGKRLLHHWLCAPSCMLEVIKERQQAVHELLQQASLLQDVRALLATQPDFERHLAQIHHFGSKHVQERHPDGRAILFEEKMYNKKKMQNFIAVLQGFETLQLRIPQLFEGCQSRLLQRLTQLPKKGGAFPDLSAPLTFFKEAFDHDKAAESGVIAPEAGVDEDYDKTLRKIKAIDESLKQYLQEQEKHFGCRLNYFGTDKKRFQLEVPENKAGKADADYALESQRKAKPSVKRYSTSVTRDLLKQMLTAEDERNAVLKDLSRRIFEKFSQHYTLWKQCIDCVATLDVLAALAEYARQQPIICIPSLQESTTEQQAFIVIEDGYHPCMLANNYIPNGIALGTNDTAPLSILTGPNMGGKSTLMRQIGLLVVMAQIGAHVPAQSCCLSLVDRIFTRLGAQDDILAGHSTFLVELNETSLILKHATSQSLVLLDELGRGTATYDGTAIAASVVDSLADLRCRCLFSTHYHNLIDFFHKDARITLGHMACMVENDDTEDPTQETVTFLYKYSKGACPKSYGFNAAKLAGMPHVIIKRAYALSKKVEAIALKRKILSKITSVAVKSGTVDSQVRGYLKNLILQLQQCKI